MVKTKIGYYSIGEPLLTGLRTDQSPRSQRMVKRKEYEVVEAKLWQLEINMESIYELLQELKPKKDEKKPKIEPKTLKRDQGEPRTSKNPF